MTCARAVAACALAALPLCAAAADYATCLLDRMPKAPNNTVAQTAIKQCLEAHPAGFRGVNRGSGRGWFSFSHPDECILSKAATTPNQMAAGMIATACSCLYGDRRVDTGPTCADHLQP